MTYKRKKGDTALKCPYCGHQFRMTTERYLSQKDKDGYAITDCKNCGKYFKYINVGAKYAREHDIEVTKPLDFCVENTYNTTTINWPDYYKPYIFRATNEYGYVDIKDKTSVHPSTTIHIDNIISVEDYIEHIYADVHKGIVVVKWVDGSVTKVATDDNGNEIFDLEHGVNAAIVKKLYQSRNHFLKFITEKTTYIQPKKLKKKTKNG